jgi:energy-coupling factor transporter ATP-binding protein EcfA2
MIVINKLNFRYDEDLVLKGINLEFEEGCYTAIIGANGSGKTTLAKHLNALFLPNQGTVSVEGIDSKKNPIEVRKKVGFVFQNPEDQLIYSIVEEDIAFGLENLKVKTSDIRRKVNQVTANLGIRKLAKKNVNTLSAGQKQLVALAGILVMEPKYIVLDEPTTLLDNKNKKNILSIIRSLNKQGIGIILITNVLSDINQSKKVVILKNGKVIFNGRKKSLNSKILKGAGLND